MMDERFIAAWAERLRSEIPGAVAVLLKGSHVRGNAGPWSDLELDVLTLDEEIADEYLAWIVDDGDGRLVHVAVERLNDWLDGFRDVASWSFGLPSHEAARLLWLGRPSLRAELDRASWEHPGGEPELEDFFEGLGKARNARIRGDELSLRQPYRESPSSARLCSRRSTNRSGPAPGQRRWGPRWTSRSCLGLSGRASMVDEVLAASERLVFGTLALLEANGNTIGPLLPPDIPHLIRSGVLRHYLEQGSYRALIERGRYDE